MTMPPIVPGLPPPEPEPTSPPVGPSYPPPPEPKRTSNLTVILIVLAVGTFAVCVGVGLPFLGSVISGLIVH